MQVDDLIPATRPTFYFVGVTTAGSSIMRVFPRWAEHLGLGECGIRGIDCRQHDSPEAYRRIVEFLRRDPLSLGGLVTTHKIDLFRASSDLFDELGPYARMLGEISCISKRDGMLVGHAKDPITSGLSLEAFVPNGYWHRTRAEVCLLGAGGSSLALTTYFMKIRPGDDLPSRIHVTNRSVPRLEAMREVHARINPGIDVEYVHAPAATDNDRVVDALPPGSLVVNGTGLGKDAPGSPLTDAATFPLDGMAWEFNYRGDLVFMEQATRQAKERRLHVEDGWDYFLHGWTRVVAEVFGIDIPVSGPEFEALSRIAARERGQGAKPWTRSPSHSTS